jgi:REP element-mobilizing transposase RayT
MLRTLAYHVIVSTYGFWLPNDPRGSWSDFVGAWELFRYGGHATKVDTSESLARQRHDRKRRSEVKRHLKFPPVHFTGLQARAVATGFHRAVLEGEYAIHALAILRDHAHLIIGRHDRSISQIVAHLKARATQQLALEGLHPLARFADETGVIPSPWARKYWKVFIDREEWVCNAIDYVERNPEKEGKRRQSWKLIVPYRL